MIAMRVRKMLAQRQAGYDNPTFLSAFLLQTLMVLSVLERCTVSPRHL